jgi:hypothetical protein
MGSNACKLINTSSNSAWGATMFIQEYGMIVIGCWHVISFLRQKNQMTHMRNLLLKPHAHGTYLIFGRNQLEM